MKIVLALTVGAVISAAVNGRADPGSILLGIAVIALIWQMGRCMQRIEDAFAGGAEINPSTVWVNRGRAAPGGTRSATRVSIRAFRVDECIGAEPLDRCRGRQDGPEIPRGLRRTPTKAVRIMRRSSLSTRGRE